MFDHVQASQHDIPIRSSAIDASTPAVKQAKTGGHTIIAAIADSGCGKTTTLVHGLPGSSCLLDRLRDDLVGDMSGAWTIAVRVIEVRDSKLFDLVESSHAGRKITHRTQPRPRIPDGVFCYFRLTLNELLPLAWGAALKSHEMCTFHCLEHTGFVTLVNRAENGSGMPQGVRIWLVPLSLSATGGAGT
jgi:hypothetical protein